MEPLLDDLLVLEPGVGADLNLRETGVELMSLCLRYWEQTTGKSKIDLAEESYLWKASLDAKGTYRTRTFDRYLSLKSLPQKPRWRTVLQTAYFVINNCPDTFPDIKLELSSKCMSVEKMLTA